MAPPFLVLVEKIRTSCSKSYSNSNTSNKKRGEVFKLKIRHVFFVRPISVENPNSFHSS